MIAVFIAKKSMTKAFMYFKNYSVLCQFPIPLFSLFSKFLLNLVLIAFQRRITLRSNEVYEDDNFLLLLPLHKKISECVVYHIKYSSGIGNFETTVHFL